MLRIRLFMQPLGAEGWFQCLARIAEIMKAMLTMMIMLTRFLCAGCVQPIISSGTLNTVKLQTVSSS